jgi:putative addiction module CopG family antidote
LKQPLPLYAPVSESSSESVRTRRHAAILDARWAYLFEKKEQTTSRTTTVTIGERHVGFIRALVRTGRYSSADEVVQAALQLLVERESRSGGLGLDFPSATMPGVPDAEE